MPATLTMWPVQNPVGHYNSPMRGKNIYPLYLEANLAVALFRKAKP